MSRTALLTTSSFVAVLAGLPLAQAADFIQPPKIVIPPAAPQAVSAANAKVGVFGGSIDGLSGWGVNGAVSLPLHDTWGLQIDGLGGAAGGSTFWGVGGHLFWRDPTVALFGVYASWVDWSPIGAQVGKVGGEFEIYHGAWTIGGDLVGQGGSFSGLAGSINLAAYLTDDLKVSGGYRFLQGIGSIGDASIEWQHDTSGIALFANGSWGQSGYQTIIGGIKFYAGPQKSLIRRNREDDPPIALPLDLFKLPPSPVICVGDGCLLPVT